MINKDRLVDDLELHIVGTAICAQHFAVNSTSFFREFEDLMGERRGRILSHVAFLIPPMRVL